MKQKNKTILLNISFFPKGCQTICRFKYTERSVSLKFLIVEDWKENKTKQNRCYVCSGSTTSGYIFKYPSHPNKVSKSSFLKKLFYRVLDSAEKNKLGLAN